MKILLLTYEIYNGGGNFIRACSMARELARMGHAVTLISSRGNIGTYARIHMSLGATVIESPDVFPRVIRNDGLSPVDLMWRVWHVWRQPYDLVHGFGHRPTVSIPSFFHRFLYSKPYIADWCDLWGNGGIADERTGIFGKFLGYFDQVTEGFVYRRVSAVTVISRTLEKRARALGLLKRHTFLLPAGSSVDVIIPRSQKESRRELGLPQKIPLVVYVGFTKHDQRFLADSFIELASINPQVQLLLLGEKLLLFWKAINAAKIASRVIHLGIVSHEKLGKYLACGDVMLLPYTNREINRARFPNKLGDYLAAGRPVVSNLTGDIKWVFKKHAIGYLTREIPYEFARAIQSLLIDSKRRKQFGKNARQAGEVDYSWKVLVKTLEQFYEHVRTS